MNGNHNFTFTIFFQLGFFFIPNVWGAPHCALPSAVCCRDWLHGLTSGPVPNPQWVNSPPCSWLSAMCSRSWLQGLAFSQAPHPTLLCPSNLHCATYNRGWSQATPFTQTFAGSQLCCAWPAQWQSAAGSGLQPYSSFFTYCLDLQIQNGICGSRAKDADSRKHPLPLLDHGSVFCQALCPPSIGG